MDLLFLKAVPKSLIPYKGKDSWLRTSLSYTALKRKERGSVALLFITQLEYANPVEDIRSKIKVAALRNGSWQARKDKFKVLRSESKESGREKATTVVVYPFEVSCATNEKCRPKSELEQSEQLARGLVTVNQERRKEAVTGKRLRRQWIAELQDKQSLLLTLNSEHGLLWFNFSFR